MKNLCKNCGKYTDELDDFGYCNKCSAKLFKQSKNTTVEQLKIKRNTRGIVVLILFLICIGICFYYKDNILKIISLSFKTTSSNPISDAVQSIIPIEDRVLTAENYETLSKEFSEKNKDSDAIYYYSYACMYYIAKDGFSSISDFSLTESQQKEIMYSRIYGKTINQLATEGKKLMQDNNITIEEYKQSLKDLNDLSNED